MNPRSSVIAPATPTMLSPRPCSAHQSPTCFGRNSFAGTRSIMRAAMYGSPPAGHGSTFMRLSGRR